MIQSAGGNVMGGDPTGNISGQDPLLGPLRDNGGATLTHALLPGSPAIDRGSAEGLVADQRGFVRPFDVPSVGNTADGCDIGAFEFVPSYRSVSSQNDLSRLSLRCESN